MECFRLLFDHLAWIKHQFLSGIRKSIHQSWLAKGLLYWGFKGVQEEIPSKEASSLQIGSVAFPPGQYTSPQLYPVTDYLSKMGIKTVRHPSYSPDVDPYDFWLFPELRSCCYETIEEMKKAVTKIIDTLTQKDFHGAFQKLLQLVHCSWKRLLRRGLEFHVCTLNKSTHTKKVWKLIVCSS